MRPTSGARGACALPLPGIKINYANGDSESEDGSVTYGSSAVVTTPKQDSPNSTSAKVTYIANKNTKKFHYPYCNSVGQVKEAILQGYKPCGNCNL